MGNLKKKKLKSIFIKSSLLLIVICSQLLPVRGREPLKIYLEEVLSIISLKDEVEKVRKKKLAVQEKIRRMTKVYMDGLFPDEEYHRQKKLLELELESLVVPQANAAEATKAVVTLPVDATLNLALQYFGGK